VEKGQQEIIWPHFWDSDYQLGQKITFSNIIILADVLQPRSGVKQSIYALQRHTHTHKKPRQKKEMKLIAVISRKGPFTAFLGPSTTTENHYRKQ